MEQNVHIAPYLKLHTVSPMCNIISWAYGSRCSAHRRVLLCRARSLRLRQPAHSDIIHAVQKKQLMQQMYEYIQISIERCDTVHS